MFKILLVDDDREEYELITAALEILNVKGKVVQIQHCQDVLQAIKDESPDLVFMDINMPLVKGIECLRNVRSDKKFQDLPIVMYSTSQSSTDIEQSFREKATLYVVKPDNFNKLLDSLQKVLSLHWRKDIPKESFLIA